MTSPPKNTGGSWAALRFPVFRVLLFATILSNIGTWMHEVGASWLMTQLSDNPLHVALIQTATALPILLFALPAGALSDLLNKKKLLLCTQLFMATVALSLALLTYAEVITPYSLIFMTFLMGTGTALIIPTWQTIVPGLVEKSALPSALALNSLGINISRAIGPAIAGICIIQLGYYSPFAINALSFLFIMAALLWWKPTMNPPSNRESFFEAIAAGLRYSYYSEPLKHTLGKSVFFFVCASSFWSLLPLLVSRQVAGDANTFGIATACVGLGAILGAALLAKLRKSFNATQIGNGAMIFAVLLLAAASKVTTPVMLYPVCALFGLGWITAMATFNLSAQTALPDWVRGRGLSVFMMCFAASMSLGGIIWGSVTKNLSLPISLQIAAFSLLIGWLFSRKLRLNAGAHLDLNPALHWPQPTVDDRLDADEDKSVMVTIEYQISADDKQVFLEKVSELGRIRKQHGALRWDILEDSEQPGVFLEYFIDASWKAHLRHHDRVSGELKAIQDNINLLHCGELPPIVKHYLTSL